MSFDLDLSKYNLGWSDEVEYAYTCPLSSCVVIEKSVFGSPEARTVHVFVGIEYWSAELARSRNRSVPTHAMLAQMLTPTGSVAVAGLPSSSNGSR